MKKMIFSLKITIVSLILLFSFYNSGAKDIQPIDRDSIFNNLVIYQIMVEAYINGDPNCDYNVGYGPSDHKGDLKGITKALPYIKSLGVNAVWLTPIFDSNGDSRLDATGYFCENYFKVDPKFGTLADAKELVNKAHKLGLYVFLDGVLGHHKKSGVPKSPGGNRTVIKSSVSETAVSYPESLEFYKEVVTYWIDELEIDGWRFDQSYQLAYKGGQNRNYWKDIREVVEDKCRERELEGKKWGILGYMVGEDWAFEKEEAKNIQKNTYSEGGLQSAFDFPSRYQIVRSLACDSERKVSLEGAKVLSYIYSKPNEKGYFHEKGVFPNLFITNHDLVRFGNLLNWRYNIDRSDEEYWKRHKCALGILAAHKGPITLYYGDEYGDMLNDYTGEPVPEFIIAKDNVSRSNGKISGFTFKENELISYTQSLMKIRNDYPALSTGESTILRADSSIYVDLRTRGENKILFLVNYSKGNMKIKVNKNTIGGINLINLENDKLCPVRKEEYVITVPGLSTSFYQVL